jgi:epoxyqueuosine reductase
MATIWDDVTAALDERGWRVRVVAAEHLGDLRRRVAAALDSGALAGPAAGHLAEEVAFALPEGMAARSVVIGAVARPLTQATLTLDGAERTVPVPPHYAGYFTVPGQLTAGVATALAPSGYRAVRFGAPFKTLAVCSGLARYGRNNIAYVPGLGSYVLLAACVSDAPPPDDAEWIEPRQLERCDGCRACLRACPTGAVQAERFLLQADRCLTWVNEDRAPFPDWVDPTWHTCAVGCLRCQQVCPENADVELTVTPPGKFDKRETAAILAAERSQLAAVTLDKLERCGLDYSPGLIARNLRVLLHG